MKRLTDKQFEALRKFVAGEKVPWSMLRMLRDKGIVLDWGRHVSIDGCNCRGLRLTVERIEEKK